MTATWADERIAKLVESSGKEGLAMYGAYWRVLEVVAGNMASDTKNCSATYSVTRWSLLLSVRGSHVSHYLGHLSKNELVTLEWIDSDIRVTIPNLLKYRDEYSKRSGHSPDKLTPRTEGDTDTDRDKNKPSCSSGDERARIQPISLTPIRRDFEEWWADASWIKVSKKAAGTAYAKARKDGASKDVLLTAAKTQGPFLKSRAESEGRSVLHPATWLNQGRYLDEEDAYKPRDGPKSVQKSMFIDRNAQQDQKFLERMQRDYERQVQH